MYNGLNTHKRLGKVSTTFSPTREDSSRETDYVTLYIGCSGLCVTIINIKVT